MTETTVCGDDRAPAQTTLRAECREPEELQQLKFRNAELKAQRDAAFQLMDRYSASKTVKAGFWGGIAADFLLKTRRMEARLADAESEQRRLHQDVSEAQLQLQRYAEAHVAALKQIEASERLVQSLYEVCTEASSLLAAGQRAKRLMEDHAAALKAYNVRQPSAHLCPIS